MDDRQKTIIKNVKAVMDFKKITREELAKEIYKDATNPPASYVANWFNRGIPNEYLEQTAEFLGVTVYALENEDLSEGLDYFMNNIDNIDLEKVNELLEKSFPFVSSEKALKNKNFSKAYEMHNVIRQIGSIINPKKFYDYSYICYKFYEEAYKDGFVEGLVNMLSVSSFYKFIICKTNVEGARDILAISENASAEEMEEFDNIIEKVIKGNEEIDDFTKQDYASIGKDFKAMMEDKNTRKKLFDSNSENADENKIFIANTTNEIMDILCELNKYSEYKDLVEFYIYQLTSNNLIKISDYDDSKHEIFGDMYGDVLRKLGNKYILEEWNNINIEKS